MSALFDNSADTYDETFTHTIVGSHQRNRVWQYLEARLPNDEPWRILELNGGTGEDAIFLAQRGHDVTLTDISADMMAVAKNKIKAEKLDHKITVRQLDIRKLGEEQMPGPFDLIFSNFGGLNCLHPDELTRFFRHASQLLTPSGRVIAVVMPRYCLIESLSFLLKGKWSSIFRRNSSKAVDVQVEDAAVPTYYFSPGDMTAIAGTGWSVAAKQAVGFIPSYMEGKVASSTVVRQGLFFLRRILLSMNWTSVADHYLIDFSKNKKSGL